jgi:hypothetical protein
MQSAPLEVWATYSVKDHCAPRAFIADVMLYDRLVLPVPPDEKVDGKPEWDRWQEQDWQPAKQQMIIKMLGDTAIAIPWTLERQGRWRNRRDALGDNAFWATADLICGDLPIYAYGVAGTVGPAYPSLDDLKEELSPISEEATKPIPGAALPVVLGQRFLVIDDPDRSYEYQLNEALSLAHDPEFRSQRTILAQWQQQFLRDGLTDRASIAKAIKVMDDLIGAQQASARKTRLRTIVRYGYRIGLAAVGAIGTVLGGPAGIGLAIGGASMSVGELVVEKSFLEAGASVGANQPSPAAFFITARKALPRRRRH